jgi:hypothetical protein
MRRGDSAPITPDRRRKRESYKYAQALAAAASAGRRRALAQGRSGSLELLTIVNTAGAVAATLSSS